MANLTLKGIPEPLYARLKERARAHRRSLNSESLVALEHAVFAAPLDAVETLSRIDALRARVRAPTLTAP
jgi:plasmid stability protein